MCLITSKYWNGKCACCTIDFRSIYPGALALFKYLARCATLNVHDITMVGIYQLNPATIEEDRSYRYRHFKTRTPSVSSFSIRIVSKTHWFWPSSILIGRLWFCFCWYRSDAVLTTFGKNMFFLRKYPFVRWLSKIQIYPNILFACCVVFILTCLCK